MLRTQRLKSGLSQKDLAALIPRTGHNRVSCVERNIRPPNAREILAYRMIFGTLPDDLFPGLVSEVEAGVLRSAQRLLNRLQANQSDQAARTRDFLVKLIAPAAHRTRPDRV